ncbi:carbohydrate ABC transporter permease [Pedococcus sp. 5OH_020]|uniref:carbohydrate ABC transporter permease n=1 Tax=Pedococcus sp. 5OH_020 TaxID=2989814 RepID=UPI0022E9DF86|nr:sugar ABC transporter permease [Pedococcus sp. 5OH_020]
MKGSAGWDNYRTIIENPAFPRVIVNTVVWVVLGVVLTTLVSLPLAQLMSKEFWGNRFLRIALIVPWATSVVMSAIGFRWILNYYYGVLNPLLMRLHVIAAPVDWLGSDRTIRWVMIGVVAFVSLPFTCFALLSGLRTISDDVLEAAAIDGAGRWQSYRHIVLPLLRGPLTVTVLLNSIWIFNSFPIVYVLNKSNPGYLSDTSTTFMYKVAFLTERDVGAGAAMSVLNVIVIGVGVALYVRRSRME